MSFTVGMVHTSFEWLSVIITSCWVHGDDFENGLKISMAKESSATVPGKGEAYFPASFGIQFDRLSESVLLSHLCRLLFGVIKNADSLCPTYVVPLHSWLRLNNVIDIVLGWVIGLGRSSAVV